MGRGGDIYCRFFGGMKIRETIIAGGEKERRREEIFIKEAERSTATQLKRKDLKIHEIVHNNVLILLTSR